ncbi:acyl-CoA dehydrogenase C-terminal domain-containing protein, partial [Nocardia sp. NPDC004278]
KFIDSEAGNGRLKGERKLLATALEDVQAMAAALTGHLIGAQEQPSELYKVGLGSVRFLMSVGDLLIGWQLLRQAEIAIVASDNGAKGADKAFYEGKVAVAQFFARNILPELTATRTILSNLDNDIMELDETAF